MKFLTATLAIVMAFACTAVRAQTPTTGRRIPPQVPSVKQEGVRAAHADLSYANASAAQKLDLYLPSAQAAPFPLLVMIHGGGFAVGSRTMVSAAIVKAFLAKGFAVASVDYRLSGEAPFPAAVQDVFSALGFIKEHAADWHIDPDKIVVYGESAGANLASMLGTAYGHGLFTQGLSARTTSVRPAGVIAHFPPVDFLQLDTLMSDQGCPASTINHNSATSFESRYLQAAIQSVPTLAAQANPATHAKQGVAPFFVQNGSTDCFVGSAQAFILVKAIQAAGGQVVYEQIEGADHGGAPFETETNLTKLISFAAEVIR